MVFLKPYLKQTLLLSLTFLFYLSGYTQQYKTDDFSEVMPPKYPTKEWLELNRAPLSFKVVIVNNVLAISKATERHQTQLDVEGGTLIGINRGEWGGVLLYKNRVSTDTIKGGNIVKIFKFQNQIYFLEGLAHMSFNSGSLYKLNKQSNKFSYDKVLDFEDAPESFTILNDKIFVAGFGNFYIVKNEKCETIFKGMFWESLYPNSVAALNDNEVYLGIKGGYVKLNISNKTLKFYKYKHLSKVVDP